MKILAAGDIHGDSKLTERLVERAVQEEVDLVILCGDITGENEKSDNLIGPFLKANKRVLIVPGNHETIATADFLAEMYGIKNIHGYSVKYQDVGIFGCSGSNVGLFQLPEEEIFSLLKQGHDKINYLPKKIMVTHVHPSGTIMERFSNFVPGSSGIKKAIDELMPDLLLCSHVHEAQGIEEMVGKTTIINVGQEGKIINI